MESKHITIRIDLDLLEKVEAYAEREGRSRSNAIIRIIKDQMVKSDSENNHCPRTGKNCED